jgi:two-component system response regulator HydG
MVRQVAPSRSSVLITGESGSGKEMIAEALHYNSPRKDKPFIKLHCAALTESLLESELFGHEKGAFTGAIATKVGRFEEADGGTLFLDEIGDMPAAVQAKLLRALEEFAFTRLGGKENIRVDLRVIAATNQPIDSLVNGGKFRLDLFHRLNGLSLWIPPLRERPEDLEALAAYFVRQFCDKYGKPVKDLDADTSEVLRGYKWPGNVRELKNCIERAVVVCDVPTLLPDHLPDSVRSAERAAAEGPVQGGAAAPDGADYRTTYMRKIILEALERTNGNRNEAAQLLKISRKTLYNRMKELGIRHDFA